MQSERLRESVLVTIQDGKLHLENTGVVPVQIREIRVMNDDGHITSQQKVDESILVSQQDTILAVNSIINQTIQQIAQSHEPVK